MGKRLYKKHGFEVMKEALFDGRDYGGRSRGTQWVMFRPARNVNSG